MKRLSKMLALGMAAALVFGMTVSAAGAPALPLPSKGCFPGEPPPAVTLPSLSHFLIEHFHGV